jgi:hypothetical protein
MAAAVPQAASSSKAWAGSGIAVRRSSAQAPVAAPQLSSQAAFLQQRQPSLGDARPYRHTRAGDLLRTLSTPQLQGDATGVCVRACVRLRGRERGRALCQPRVKVPARSAIAASVTVKRTDNRHARAAWLRIQSTGGAITTLMLMLVYAKQTSVSGRSAESAALITAASSTVCTPQESNLCVLYTRGAFSSRFVREDFKTRID